MIHLIILFLKDTFDFVFKDINPLQGGAQGWVNLSIFKYIKIKTAMRRKIIPYNPKLKHFAKSLRKNMSLSEVLLWNELKQKKMLDYDFDRQRPIDEFIVDFYCKDLMLAIEVDDESHEFKVMYDKRRQKKLESFGISFMRFTEEEVKYKMDIVIRTIQNWILIKE